MTHSYSVRVLAALLAWLATPAAATTITLINQDSPGEGFNDPTLVAAADGFPAGTSLGQKRIAVFEAAAARWAAVLNSAVDIKIQAKFDPMLCTQFSANLGATVPLSSANDFPGAPHPNTRYVIALAEAISGANINGALNEINVVLNSSIDSGCFGAGTWWYGTSGANSNPGGHVSLLPVALHEIAHGLGFVQFACINRDGNGNPLPCGMTPFGGYNSNRKDIWSYFLYDLELGLLWYDMSNDQRGASSINDPDLVWNGALVTAAIPMFQPGMPYSINGGRLRLHAPSMVTAGSSVTHFTSNATPNLLMEPSASIDVFDRLDFSVALLQDIGWPLQDVIFANGFQ